MTRILLVRHATSAWNAEGRWQGQADPPLSETGRAEARSAATPLRDSVGAVVASDLERAFETATILASELDLDPPAPEPGLREIDVGEWSGLTRGEIEERWPGLLEEWRAGRLDRIPGGEERDRFRARVLESLERVASHGRTDLLVVTHAGVIGVLERHLGVHPGTSVPRLAGRWFEVAETISAGAERVHLLPA
ncbi:MAG: histidine phosphatase family protein [Candidatus Binatia bacterium]